MISRKKLFRTFVFSTTLVLGLALSSTNSPVRAEGAVQITPATRNDKASAVTIQIADEKKALLPIVLSPKAGTAIKNVAIELSRYLEAITGAKFETQVGDGSKGIVLGTLEEFPNPALNEGLEIYNAVDGNEAFAIRTEAKRVLLIGATELGASHAAFRFLEVIGYRHIFPHAAWEIIPSIEKLSFNRDITDRPQLLARNVWFEAGSGGAQQNEDYVAWRRHNRQAESFIVNAGHNLFAVADINAAEFAAHPEYLAGFPQPDGTIKREGPQLELSNPRVRELIVKYAVDFFKQNPNADMVSLDPADTHNHSQTPAALAMGSVSDQVFGMANEAAIAVEKAYPGQGKMVGLYSYNEYWDPPTFDLEPNVHVLMSGLGQGKMTPAERDAAWPSKSKNLGFYEYFSVWLWSFDKLPGSWTNNVKGLQGAMRGKIAMGATSISAESTASWGSNGRGYFFANKLMWNPDIDVDAELEDFYTKAFGAGAPAMKRYYNRLDPGNRPFMSNDLLARAFRDLQEASEATKDDPKIEARLDHLKLYLNYIYLDWRKARDATLTAEQKERANFLIMSNLYRTSPYALTAWEMIRQNWGGNKYPGNADAPPWMTGKLYEHKEVEEDFKEALVYFQPSDIGEALSFSQKLVPILWSAEQRGEAGEAAKSYQSYQGGAKYGFYSVGGEPLEFTTEAGDAWGGINRYTITDGAGGEISKGVLPNKETTEHSIDVPGPGLYWLDYNDNGSYWNITVAAGIPATIPTGQNQDFRNSAVMSDMYFYVPKGTKKIEYYYTRTNFHPGGAHQVLDPSGKVAKVSITGGKQVETVDISGDWASVQVPAGLDGKVWRFHEPVMGMFWFNNIPNNFAASPEALMVPSELAEKDDLAIRK